VTAAPLVCTLLPADLADRRRVVLDPLRAAALEVRSTPSGVALRFAPQPGTVERLAEFIELERQCCGFLSFELRVEPAGGPVWLTLSGPEGTGEMLSQELGLTAVEAAPAAP
jgi:hypothetical protein